MKITVRTSRLRETPQARDVGLAGLAGVLMALPFVNFRLWPLAWVALIPLLVALRGKSARSAFGLSYVAGVVFFAIVLHWLCSLVYWVGGIVLVGIILLVLYLALYWGFFGALVRYGATKFGMPVWFTGAALWVLLEYVQSKLFTGFGWALVGYSQAFNPTIVQWASIGGIFLVSGIVVLSNTLIYSVIFEPRRLVRLVVTLVLIVFSFVIGGMLKSTTGAGKELRVAVVQGNFWQDVFWDPESAGNSLLVYERLSSEAIRDGAELVIWPESAIPGYLELDERLEEELKRYAERRDVHILLGAKRAEKEPGWRFFNSAYLINADGQIVDWYDKMHLAPFGEYLPLRKVLPFLEKIVPALGDFSPGKRRTVFAVNDVKFGVLICFETVFPDLARALAREDTDFLTTITNVAWYGRSAAAYQDLAICVFRAVENRMWLARAANSGISCFVDPQGKVRSLVLQEGAPVFVRGWSSQVIDAGKRFALYTLVGDLVVAVAAVWLASLVLVARRRSRRSIFGEVGQYG